jgi:Family of unknown function (DUF6886)
MLFHVSEASGIERFEPRVSGDTSRPVVWAIDAGRLRNYLVPRDCPRVTYYADGETTPADVERFLGSSPTVVAVECGWLERLRSCRLYRDHLPPETFECLDECAGYFVSRVPVVPVRVEIVDDPIAELRRRRVELRLVPSLWPLRDAVVASTLRVSLIRLRHAVSRTRASPVVGPERATSGLTWIPVGTARPVNSSVSMQVPQA